VGQVIAVCVKCETPFPVDIDNLYGTCAKCGAGYCAINRRWEYIEDKPEEVRG
jgi:hypothetical protein